MKKLILTTFISLLLISSFSQETKPKNTYYKTSDTGKILSLSEYKDSKNKLLEKFKVISEEVKINEILMDSVVSYDSIIKTYKFDVKIGKANKKENIYNYLNKKLPSQVLYTIENNEFNIKDLEGKPTVINFWFTECAPCIDEMPALNRLKAKYSDKVNFISITFNNREKVKIFMKKHRFDFLKIVGAKNFIDELGIQAFPKNIFLDKNGIVRKIEGGIPYILENGEMKIGNGEGFENYIKKLLSQ